MILLKKNKIAQCPIQFRNGNQFSIPKRTKHVHAWSHVITKYQIVTSECVCLCPHHDWAVTTISGIEETWATYMFPSGIVLSDHWYTFWSISTPPNSRDLAGRQVEGHALHITSLEDMWQAWRYVIQRAPKHRTGGFPNLRWFLQFVAQNWNSLGCFGKCRNPVMSSAAVRFCTFFSSTYRNGSRKCITNSNCWSSRNNGSRAYIKDVHS